MIFMSNTTDLLSKTNHQRAKKGETISQLAHRHLLDENHTTTDEELQNVRLELSENNALPQDDVHKGDETLLWSSLRE